MSDIEKANGGDKAKSAWTDKERLVYLIGLLEHSGTKLDFKTAPRPNGRSEIACERMVGRLKTAYKPELEALKIGNAFDGEATPKKTLAKPKTPSKRKRKGDDTAEDNGSPKKMGKKAGAKEDIKAEDEDEI